MEFHEAQTNISVGLDVYSNVYCALAHWVTTSAEIKSPTGNRYVQARGRSLSTKDEFF